MELGASQRRRRSSRSKSQPPPPTDRKQEARLSTERELVPLFGVASFDREPRADGCSAHRLARDRGRPSEEFSTFPNAKEPEASRRLVGLEAPPLVVD